MQKIAIKKTFYLGAPFVFLLIFLSVNSLKCKELAREKESCQLTCGNDKAQILLGSKNKKHYCACSSGKSWTIDLTMQK